METGFIGKWGEMHGSSNELLGGEYGVNINDNTRTVISELLDALPEERMLAVR